MELRECACQSGTSTLEEGYSDKEFGCDINTAMIRLIKLIREHPSKRTAYGLISVGRLCLLSQDGYTTPRWVTIFAHPPIGHMPDKYIIECTMPVTLSPWLYPTLRQEVTGVEEALEIVLLAMDYTRGWDATIGGKPIGLAEIIEREFCDFRVSGSAEKCRALFGDWRNVEV